MCNKNFSFIMVKIATIFAVVVWKENSILWRIQKYKQIHTTSGTGGGHKNEKRIEMI